MQRPWLYRKLDRLISKLPGRTRQEKQVVFDALLALTIYLLVLRKPPLPPYILVILYGAVAAVAWKHYTSVLEYYYKARRARWKDAFRRSRQSAG